MAKFAQRIEIVGNGIVITNRQTGNKEMNPNRAKIAEYAKSFVTEQIENGEPGEYYDVDIIITKQRNKSPKA
jgi:hypothetical protein